jgi:hypothetical protein
MPRFEFRFAIPTARMGDRGIYESYVATLDRLAHLKGATQGDGVRVEEVHATSGSVMGTCLIEAPSYTVPWFCCRRRTRGWEGATSTIRHK